MFALERIKIIKKYLLENQKAEVAVLSDILDVTEVTIRRDLEKLEHEGFLKRIHGGAVLADEPDDSSFHREWDPLQEERLEIGQIAAHFVDDNDVIMLTQGPTILQLARSLGEKRNLTILTNDLLIALELTAFPQIKTILLGGDMDTQDRCVYGNYTVNSLKNFFVAKTFFEVDGVDEEHGFTVSSIEKARLIQESLNISREAVCLCSSDRFGETGFFPVGKLDLASRIVTNSDLEDRFKDMVFEKGIPLFTSLQVYEGHV